MSGHIENLSPNYRRSFQTTGTSFAALVGTINTGVCAFNGALLTPNGALTLKWGTALPIGTTGVAPVAASQNWCNVISSAALGCAFKINRRGFYRFDASCTIFSDSETPTAFVAALILDGSAASALATATLSPTMINSSGDPGVIAFTRGAQGLNNQAVNFGGTVPITDALAGATQPTTAAGITGRGVVRLHMNDGPGVIATTFDNTDISLWCNYTGDVAG